MNSNETFVTRPVPKIEEKVLRANPFLSSELDRQIQEENVVVHHGIIQVNSGKNRGRIFLGYIEQYLTGLNGSQLD